MTEPTKTFKFSAGPKGFEYDPSGDWAYNRHDTIRFETQSGPFELEFIPKSAPTTKFNPLGGPLKSTKNSSGAHVADTTVNDGLNDEQREAIRTTNISPANPDGFIARYIYAIRMLDDAGKVIAKDDTHNGTYSC